MILWLEFAARDALLPHLEEGQDSVGVRVDVEHLAATPQGASVRYRAEVVSVDGRKVRFAVEAHDGVEVVGKGFHERFVVDVARFARGLQKRFDQRY